MELTAVPVKFSLSVDVRAIGHPTTPPPTSAPDVFVCTSFPDSDLPCVKLPAPAFGAVYTGTVQATAPWAAMQAPLHIVAMVYPPCACEFPPATIVTDATTQVESAGDYSVSFDGFNLMDTRSNSTDTVWLNLQGQLTSTPVDISATSTACQYVGETWCIIGHKYGNVHKSGYRAMSGQVVGDFRLTPEKQNDMRALFYLYNYGTSAAQQIADGVANGFSKAGEAILSAYGAATGSAATVQFAQQLDSIIESSNNAATASCDGPLVLDAAIFNNQSVDGSNVDTLDNLTREAGIFTYTPGVTYRYKDGDFVCDRRGSAYTVTLSAHRNSWRPWIELP